MVLMMMIMVMIELFDRTINCKCWLPLVFQTSYFALAFDFVSRILSWMGFVTCSFQDEIYELWELLVIKISSTKPILKSEN